MDMESEVGLSETTQVAKKNDVLYVYSCCMGFFYSRLMLISAVYETFV